METSDVRDGGQEPRREAPDLLALKLIRVKNSGDPHAFRREPQSYSRVLDGGASPEAELPWDERFDKAIASLHANTQSPADLQWIGDVLRKKFLLDIGWSAEEQVLTDAIEAKRPVVLTIRSSAAELYTVPWELVTLGQKKRYVGCLPNVLLRYEWADDSPRNTTPEKPSPRAEGGRILFAHSGKVPYEAHREAIESACAAGHHDFEPARDVLSSASLRTLRDKLVEAKRKGPPIAVVHLLCHGVPIGNTFGLMLDANEGGQETGVGADQLAGLFGEHADMVRLVVLAACDSGNVGALGNHMGSVAQALHCAGVASVIASRYPLSKPGSNAFTKSFYDTLLTGPSSVEEAFKAARQCLWEGYKYPERIDWASVQLYAREADGHDTRPIVFAPHLGLSAFQRKHARFFVGREDEVKELVSELNSLVELGKPRLMIVVGASGTGKSSMVRAGAVPLLEKPEHGHWLAQVMVPGAEPGKALDAALAQLDKAVPSNAPEGAGGPRKLLVVDQFEEVLTSDVGADERTAFATRLWRLCQEEGGLGVIVTLRDDFLGRCSEIVLDAESDLRLDKVASKAEHLVFVPQMDKRQLQRAIEEPASMVGLVLEKGLTERILADVEQQPGALPLVQHTLQKMWEEREGRVLTQRVYDALGRVDGALNKHADGVVAKLVSEDEDKDNGQRVRRLLQGLVNVGDGKTPDTRRRALVDELCLGDAQGAALYRRVLDSLVLARLLVRSDTANGQTVEVAHEALIRKWSTLVQWLKEDRDKLLDRKEVLGWVEACKKGPDHFLTPGNLALAERRLQSDPVLAEGEASALVERSRREIGRLREQERRFRDTLRVALAREYMEKDPLVSVVLLREVEAKGRDLATMRTWFECAMEALVQPAMTTAVLEVPEINFAAFSPEGTRVVTCTRYEGAVRVWSAATGELVGPFAAVGVRRVGWSPVGNEILTASNDWTVRVWSAATGLPRELPQPAGQREDRADYFTAAEWSPDGKRIAIASWSRTMCVLSAATDQPPLMLSGHVAGWSPDGKKIVTDSRSGLEDSVYRSPKDTLLSVWDARTGEELCVFKEHIGPTRSVAWHPDGERIASCSDHQGVLVWDADKGTVSAHIEGCEWAWELAWSPDGTRIALAGEGAVQVLDATKFERLFTLKGHKSVAWNRDGTRIVTAANDGTARLWNVVTEEALSTARVTSDGMRAELGAHAGVVLSVTADAGGKTGTSDARSTWAALKGEVLVVLPWCSGGAVWSPDGARVATGVASGVFMWDSVTGESLFSFGYDSDRDPNGLLAWSPDGDEIATLTAVHDAKTGAIKFWLGEQPEHVGPGAESLEWSGDRKHIVSRGKGFVRFWDAKTGEARRRFEWPEGTNRFMAWSPDGKRAVIELLDMSACVWDMATGQVSKLRGPMTWSWTAAAWSHDGTRIVLQDSMSGDATVRDAVTGEVRATLRAQNADPQLSAVAWSPDDTKIVTGTKGTVRVWDAESGDPLSTHTGHHAHAAMAAFCPRGSARILTAGGGTACIWSIDAEHLRDRLWRATTYSLPAARRTELLGEDETTAKQNAEAHRKEEAQRREERPVVNVEVVIPDFEEQRRQWASAVAARSPPPAPSEAVPPPAPPEQAAEADVAVPAGAPVLGELGTAEAVEVLGELRSLFQGADQKIGELLARLPGRPPGGG